MTRGGRFLVLDWFPADAAACLSADPAVLGRITASHEAFTAPASRCQRTVTLMEAGTLAGSG